MPRCWTKTVLTALLCLVPVVERRAGPHRRPDRRHGQGRIGRRRAEGRADSDRQRHRHDERNQERRGRRTSCFRTCSRAAIRSPRPFRDSTPSRFRKSSSRPRARSTSSCSSRSLGSPSRCGRRTVAGRRDDLDDDRQHREQRRDLEAAARRPQHPELRAARAWQRQQRRRARQRVQRPARRRDQHHARRRQQQLGAVPQRRHELLHLRADPHGRDRRSDGLDRRA